MNSGKHEQSYEELEALCADLEISATRAISVKQDLIRTRDKLDRELGRYRHIQSYTERVLRLENVGDFGIITTESIVEAYEVEVALVGCLRDKEQNLQVIGAFGLEHPPDSLSFNPSWLSGREALLVDCNPPLIGAWSSLDLCEAMICPFFDQDSLLTGIVLGGRTERGKQFYPEINREFLSSFAVMTEQAGLLLRILEYSEHLEELVDERTAELKAAQSQLVETAHTAGMAEVATDVLHNIGNAINSVNVGLTLVMDKIDKLNVEPLSQIIEIIKSNSGKLDSYLTEHPRGKKVLPYMELAFDVISEHRWDALAELHCLNDQVTHICEIVTLQQSHAKGNRILRGKHRIDEIVMDSARMQNDLLERNQITMETDFSYTKHVMVERHQLLQVFVNLIRNAAQSIVTQDSDHKVIHISIRLIENSDGKPSILEISIKDTGTGFSPDLKNKMFNYGFSTKKSGGHGFGLHFCANYLQRIGGSIVAQSEGSGKGAEFIVQIPTENPRQERGT